MRRCKRCESTVQVKRVKIGYIFHPSFSLETTDNTYYSADLCSGCREELKSAFIDFVQKWARIKTQDVHNLTYCLGKEK